MCCVCPAAASQLYKMLILRSSKQSIYTTDAVLLCAWITKSVKSPSFCKSAPVHHAKSRHFPALIAPWASLYLLAADRLPCARGRRRGYVFCMCWVCPAAASELISKRHSALLLDSSELRGRRAKNWIGQRSMDALNMPDRAALFLYTLKPIMHPAPSGAPCEGSFFICTFLDISALSPICAGACGFMRFCAAALYLLPCKVLSSCCRSFYVRDYSRLFPPTRFCWISSEKLLLWNLNNMHNI